MGTTSTALPAPAPRFRGRKTWLALALAGGIAIGGAITGIEVTRGGPAPAVGPVDTRAFENSPVTGSTDRGAMSPGHRAAPRTRPAASTPGVAPAPGDQCVIVAGHTIC